MGDIMLSLKTVRGQSARIIENDDKFIIELYANGEWCNPCNCFENSFNTELEALRYFSAESVSIHC